MRTAFARIRKFRGLSAVDWMRLPRALLAMLLARTRLLLVPIARVRDWAAAPWLAARVVRALAAASARVPGGAQLSFACDRVAAGHALKFSPKHYDICFSMPSSRVFSICSESSRYTRPRF